MNKTISIEQIFNSVECKMYFKFSKEISKHFKNDTNPSPHLRKKYKKSLQNYRQFLSENGIKLPIPKYPIMIGNSNSLKFKDVIVKEKDDGTYEYIRMIINPNWIYFK